MNLALGTAPRWHNINEYGVCFGFGQNSQAHGKLAADILASVGHWYQVQNMLHFHPPLIVCPWFRHRCTYDGVSFFSLAGNLHDLYPQIRLPTRNIFLVINCSLYRLSFIAYTD